MVKKCRLFIIPGTFDLAGFSDALKGLSPEFEAPAAARPFDLLDCHDQSLRAEGRLLIEVDGALQLLQADRDVLVQACSGKGKFVQDLPDGPVKTAVKGFPKLRALMSIGSGLIESGSFAVLDDLQKTQVRGSVVTLSTDKGQATLLTVQPMRGYDRAFHAVCAALKTMAASGFDVVFASLFPGVTPYNAKPDVPLGTQEPSIEVAADIIRTYLAVARQNEAGVISDIDTEFLHDYRVSLRRVRSVLSLFKGVFSPEQTDALKREFSDLMAPTGRVRDLDVYLLEKDIYFNLIPPNLHQGAEAMFAQFAKERTRALTALSRRFRSAAYSKKMDELAALFADLNGLEPGPNADRGAYGYACALIWKRYRKVCKLARGITPGTSDEIVHDLRIDCKKLRYLMEFFGPLLDKGDFKTLIKPLKKLQDNLGLFNDYSVQQEALLEFVTTQSNAQGRANAQLAMSVGGLIAVLDQRQKAERDRVIANFQHFDSPDIQNLFRTLFHHKED
ncbi:CHAD domain-containing protein [Ruegeria arenilitoris]|uniref:CHAD domain-containing protein n=1 Tax=Ruegeria arenilitoris TaxID=1173585 RepID=UPI00147CF272|nr:CHAD domain-containing protein [Ruegeria arenilitoris]